MKMRKILVGRPEGKRQLREPGLRWEDIKRLGMCTLWGTVKFKRYSLRHITDDDVSRENKAITNATVQSEVIAGTMRLKVIVTAV
jgi:hypothetical protein